jgi:sterol desaturase/sphingolipid hydroxylase (fatty acid hydroxylase superfamily)
MNAWLPPRGQAQASAVPPAFHIRRHWQHRFVHGARVGWAAHQAHHSSEYTNFATALRQKWNPWFDFFFWLPLPLLGVAPRAIYYVYGINLVYQFFVHTETIKKLPRPVEFVFNTPSRHRVHHGSDPIYPGQELRRHPDRLGPDVRHIPAGTLPPELRSHPPG